MKYIFVIATFFTLCTITATTPDSLPETETETKSAQTEEMTLQPDIITDSIENNKSALEAINLYEALRTIEDDMDRLDLVDRPNQDIEAIRIILENKKIEIMGRLSRFKGFERLASVSHKQHFTSKTDYTVLLIACYTLAAIGLTTLAFSTINITKDTHPAFCINLPSQACLEENIDRVAESVHWIATKIF